MDMMHKSGCSNCGSKACKVLGIVAIILIALMGITGAIGLLYFWYDVFFRDSWAYAFPIERAVYVILGYVALAKIVKCGMNSSAKSWMMKACGMNKGCCETGACAPSGCCDKGGMKCHGETAKAGESCKGEACKGDVKM